MKTTSKFYAMLALEMLKGAMNFITIALQFNVVEVEDPNSPEEMTKNKQAVTMMRSKQKIAEALKYLQTMLEMDYNGKNN